MTKHPVGHIVIGVGLLPHTHPDTGELVGTQMLDEALEAIVSPGGAPLADAQLADGQSGVVRHHQHVVGGDFIEVGGGAGGLAGQVHIGNGLHDQHLFPGNGQGIGQRLEFQLLDGRLGSLGQLVGHHKAYVVAGIFILVAGVAQTDQQPGGAAAAFSKHILNLAQTVQTGAGRIYPPLKLAYLFF